jgi:hypothetical protein
VGLLEGLRLLDLEARLGQEFAPLVLGVVTNMSRVAQLLRLLVPVARVERVLDHYQPVAHALHLGNRGAHVGEVVGRDPRDDDVEAAVGEGHVLSTGENIGPHARRRVERDDLGARLAQPPRDMAAAGGDVEGLHALLGLAPLDEQVEVGPLAVSRALAISLSAV